MVQQTFFHILWSVYVVRIFHNGMLAIKVSRVMDAPLSLHNCKQQFCVKDVEDTLRNCKLMFVKQVGVEFLYQENACQSC